MEFISWGTAQGLGKGESMVYFRGWVSGISIWKQKATLEEELREGNVCYFEVIVLLTERKRS